MTKKNYALTNFLIFLKLIFGSTEHTFSLYFCRILHLHVEHTSATGLLIFSIFLCHAYANKWFSYCFLAQNHLSFSPPIFSICSSKCVTEAKTLLICLQLISNILEECDSAPKCTVCQHNSMKLNLGSIPTTPRLESILSLFMWDLKDILFMKMNTYFLSYSGLQKQWFLRVLQFN